MKSPLPTQLELVSDEPRTAKSAEEIHALAVVKLRTEVMPAIAVACSRMGKGLGNLFDARASHVADAIAFREINGSVRAFDVEWLVALLLAAPDATKLDLLATLCDVAGYRPPERKRKLNPVDENAALWRAIKKLAPGLAELIEQEVESS